MTTEKQTITGIYPLDFLNNKEIMHRGIKMGKLKLRKYLLFISECV